MGEVEYKWLLYQLIHHLKDTSSIVFDKDFIENNSKDYLCDGVLPSSTIKTNINRN